MWACTASYVTSLLPKLGVGRAGWVAHVLLATVRADLLRHVTEGEGMSHSALRSSLRDFVDDTLDH